MAWNPNEKGNPAWLTKQASQHGGVENFIEDIRKEGYSEGHEQGMSDGLIITSIVLGSTYITYKSIVYFINKYKKKMQLIKKRAEESEKTLHEIYECDDDFDGE